MFQQFGRADIQVERAVFDKGDLSCLLAHDDHGGIRFFGQTNGGSMSEAERVGEVGAIRDREEGCCGDDGFAAQDDAAVVQRGVFGEDGDKKLPGELRVETDAGVDELLEGVAAFDGDEASEFFAGEVRGGGGDLLFWRRVGHARFVSVRADGACAEGASKFGSDDEQHGDHAGVEADAQCVGHGGQAGEVCEHEAGREGQPHLEKPRDIGVGSGAAPDEPTEHS